MDNNSKLFRFFKTDENAKVVLQDLAQKMTITEIAKHYNISRDTAGIWLKTYGIEKNTAVFKNSLTGRTPKQEPDKNIHTKEFLENLYYEQHKTQQEIAHLTGIAKWTIQQLFKEYNIVPRKCRNKNLTILSETCLNDKNWLHDQHINQKKTLTQIGLELGVADVTVGRKVEEFGIPKQRSSGNYIWNIFRDEQEAKESLIELNKEKSLTEIANKYGVTIGAVSLWFKKFNIVPNIHFTSIPQKKVQEFLDTIKIPYNINDRTVLSTKSEIDIFCKEHMIGIEVDGIHFHSELFVDKKYHKKKTDECETLNIRLLHFYDTEILDKFPIICSILSNILGVEQETIFARKCIIKEIDQPAANEFYTTNHIQGKTTSKYNYALEYDKKVVSVISFSPSRFDKAIQFELTRFCSKLNTRVVGGASKLFSHFISIHSPESIVSYADRRIFNGNLYNKLGFILQKIIKEDYQYIMDKKLIRKEKMRHSRMHLIVPDYDPNKTEHQNALENNIFRIYDCGKLKFVWKK